jgi:hypothetical protein
MQAPSAQISLPQMLEEWLDRERAAGGLLDQLVEAGLGTLPVDALAQPAEQWGEGR